MASGWPGKGHGALLKNSIRARLWVHSAALEAPNRSFGDRIESHKRTLGSFSTGSHLMRSWVNRPYQMRSAPMHGIMAAPRGEDSWLTGIARTVGVNWPRTTASVLTAEPPYTKRLTCPLQKQIDRR